MVRELPESNMLELRRTRYNLVHQMVKIHKVMKEELCLELDRWKQSRLKLSKNKSVEIVNQGDLVMLSRTNKHDPPQFGLVLSLENQGRDGTVRLQTGYCLVTSVGNLVPIASGTVESRLANGKYIPEDRSNMNQRIGMEFSHFINLSLGEQQELKK